MKSLMILAAVIMSTNSFSSDTLMKLTRGSGFSPVPTSSVLSINENGKVVRVVTRKGSISKTELKVLSPNIIQSIKDKIDSIKAKAVLVDLDEGKPRCMDAPSSGISVNKNGKDLLIASVHSCHRSQIQTKDASDLIKLIQDLDTKK